MKRKNGKRKIIKYILGVILIIGIIIGAILYLKK